MKKYVFLICIIILAGCSSNTKEQPTAERLPTIEEMEYQPPEKIANVQQETPSIEKLPDKLITDDNVKIAYNYNRISSDYAVILLHMLDKNKETWNKFSAELEKNDFSSVAIDLRGHGESDGNWHDFTEQDFNNIVLDIKAAKKFLDSRGFAQVYLIGASIGANTALRYAATDPSIKKVVLLSPSENYRDVATFDVLNDYKGKLMIVSATEDPQSYYGSLQLNNKFLGEKGFIDYETDAHGTDLLPAYDDLNGKIINFFKE